MGEALRVLIDVARGFRGENVQLRAANLTYISIFSLFPIITVALMLLESFNSHAVVTELNRWVESMLVPGIRDDAYDYLDKFLSSAGRAQAGTFGFAALLVSAGFLLEGIDSSLNDIWHVRRPRPMVVRVLLYLLVLLAGPVVIAIALLGLTGLERALLGDAVPFVAYAVAAFLLSLGVSTTLYLVVPNARVKPSCAFAGALVATVGWEAGKYVFAAFAAVILGTNPLYGSLGSVPLFLAWMFLSWLLLLFGARFAYALQFASIGGVNTALIGHPRAGEWVAGQVAQRVTLSYLEDSPAPDIRALSHQIAAPEHMVADAVGHLVDACLVVEDRRGGVRPAKPPEQLTLADLSAAVGGLTPALRHELFVRGELREVAPLERAFSEADGACVASLSRVKWTDLVKPLRAPPEALRPAAAGTGRNP